MKSVFALPLLAAFAGASREAYDEICPTKDGQSEGTSYGDTVTYHCGKQFPSESLLETASAEDPDACVSHCMANEECTGSHWVYNLKECHLFSAGGEALEGNRAAIAFVFSTPEPVSFVEEQQPLMNEIQYEEAEDVEEADVCDSSSRQCRSCQKHLKDCEQSEEKLEGDLKVCKKGNEVVEGRLKKCHETAKKNEQERQKLQKEVVGLKHKMSICPRPLNQWQVCPTYKGMLLRQGRGTWRISCQQGSSGRVLRTIGGSFEHCLESCARDSRCKAINYWSKNKAPCTMISTHARMGSIVRPPLVGATLVGRY